MLRFRLLHVINYIITVYHVNNLWIINAITVIGPAVPLSRGGDSANIVA